MMYVIAADVAVETGRSEGLTVYDAMSLICIQSNHRGSFKRPRSQWSTSHFVILLIRAGCKVQQPSHSRQNIKTSKQANRIHTWDLRLKCAWHLFVWRYQWYLRYFYLPQMQPHMVANKQRCVMRIHASKCKYHHNWLIILMRLAPFTSIFIPSSGNIHHHCWCCKRQGPTGQSNVHAAFACFLRVPPQICEEKAIWQHQIWRILPEHK